MNFGQAVEEAKGGHAIERKGWNGKGIFVFHVDEAIGLKRPGYDGEMCDVRIGPFLAIDTTGLQTDNAAAQKCVVPWVPSQTDQLAEDWGIA